MGGLLTTPELCCLHYLADCFSPPGLSLVILNAAERSEESLETLMTNQGSRDFSLPLVARNDIQAKVLLLFKRAGLARLDATLTDLAQLSTPELHQHLNEAARGNGSFKKSCGAAGKLRA